MFELQFIGYVGKTIRYKEFKDYSVLNFYVKPRKGANGQERGWVTCAWWKVSQKQSSLIKPGVEVFVRGDPSIDKWNSADGTEHHTFKCKVATCIVIGTDNGGDLTESGHPEVGCND